MISRTKAVRVLSALLAFMFVLSSSVFTAVGPVYAATPIVNLSAASIRVWENAGSVQLTAVLDQAPTFMTRCSYSTSDGTAVGGDDYNVADSTLTWIAGAKRVSFSIDIEDDKVKEGDETFYVSLNSPYNAEIGSSSMVEITIVDDDTATTTQTPTISLSSSTFTGSEASKTATITVTKNGTGDASIDYSITGGTATAGSDFQNDSDTLRFSSSETTKVITVVIVDDSAVEGSETFNVMLSNSENANLGNPSSAVVTITDNDTAPPGPGTDTGSNPGGTTTTPSVSLSTSSYSATENQRTIKVTVNKSTAGAATVVLTTIGSAYTDAAYSKQSTTVSFASADTSKDITVYIKDDTVAEGTENTSITLSNASGASLGTPYRATLAINDNEGASSGSNTDGSTPGGGGAATGGSNADPPVVGFYSLSKMIGEADNILDIQIQKTGNVASVQYTVTGTAAPGVDYEGATSGTVTFGTTNYISFKGIKVINDSAVESNETIVIKLSNPSAGSVDSSKAEITLTIVDNDTPPVLQFASGNYTVKENGGKATITVVKQGSGEASVDYKVISESTDPGLDYTCPNGTLTFAAQDVEKSFDVLITNDNEVDKDEWIMFELRDPSAGASLGTNYRTFLYIDDDEVAQDVEFAKVRLSAQDYTCNENVGKFTVTVIREGNTTTECVVVYGTSDHEAAPGLDYVETEGTLIFSAGETTKTFTIDIIDDTIAGEGTERLYIGLDIDGDDLTLRLGSPFTANLDIQDNDGAAPQQVVIPVVKQPEVPVDPNKVTTIPGPNGITKSVTSLNIPEDILGHWGRDSILAVMERGVVSGYADSTMKPNRAITRGEAAVIIATALNLQDYTPKKTAAATYRDALPSWASKAVMTLTEKGLMGGYADGTFQAKKAITRAEICTILMKAFPKTKTQNTKLAFVDRGRIPSWAVQWVAQAVGCGVTGGYPNKTFQASRKVSRAETCVMLCKAAGYK